jgi:hypothetical protein
MQEQEKAGKARMIGYALGLAAFFTAVLWRFLVR